MFLSIEDINLENSMACKGLSLSRERWANQRFQHDVRSCKSLSETAMVRSNEKNRMAQGVHKGPIRSIRDNIDPQSRVEQGTLCSCQLVY